MGKKQETKIESTSVVPQATEQVEEFPTYVVVRNGIRVSDETYSDPNDPAALSEKDFWTRVAEKSHREPVKIVLYDSRKHRVW